LKMGIIIKPQRLGLVLSMFRSLRECLSFPL